MVGWGKSGPLNFGCKILMRPSIPPNQTIDIEYNKRLDRQRPCLEGDLTAGSNL